MSMPLSATDLLAELPRLRRYARVLTGDAEFADSLVEETLLRARHMSGDATSQSPRSLQLLGLLRSVNSESAISGKWAALPGATLARPAKWVQERNAGAGSLPDRAAAMLVQISELPLEQREVLVLVAVERMSYDDIAALLRIPVATVIARLSQAREALRAASPNPLSAPHNSG